MGGVLPLLRSGKIQDEAGLVQEICPTNQLDVDSFGSLEFSHGANILMGMCDSLGIAMLLRVGYGLELY